MNKIDKNAIWLKFFLSCCDWFTMDLCRDPPRGRPERPQRPNQRPIVDYEDDFDYFDEPVLRRPLGGRPNFFQEEEQYECPPQSEAYRYPDQSQCDK